MENLSQLNKALFQTLEGVMNNKVDAKKAKSVVDLSNSIINNHKLQLEAVKYAEKLGNKQELPNTLDVAEAKKEMLPAVAKSESLSKVLEMDGYEQSNAFAKHLGFKNTGEAISSLGSSSTFNLEKKKWLQEIASQNDK